MDGEKGVILGPPKYWRFVYMGGSAPHACAPNFRTSGFDGLRNLNRRGTFGAAWRKLE